MARSKSEIVTIEMTLTYAGAMNLDVKLNHPTGMIEIRRSSERGHSDHDWLDSRHTFSFGDYYDPRQMGFRSLRVINEDRVAPGKGFGRHPHRDMEIVSYVLSGTLAHKDSMGHEEKLGPNEVQWMSAGTGIVHSEYNGSPAEPVHFLQIWIEPAVTGIAPNYAQFAFEPEEKRGKLRPLATPEGGGRTAKINQDARVFVSELAPGESVSYGIASGRGVWLHVIDGNVEVNGARLETGDGAAVEDEPNLTIAATANSEILLFDLK